MRGAPRNHKVGIRISADVHVTCHDAPECGVMDAKRFFAHEARLEQHLCTTEALAANTDDVCSLAACKFSLCRLVRMEVSKHFQSLAGPHQRKAKAQPMSIHTI